MEGDFTEQSCQNAIQFLEAVGMPEECRAKMVKATTQKVAFTRAGKEVKAVQEPKLSKMCTVPETIELGKDSTGSMPGCMDWPASLYEDGNTLRGTFNLLGKPGNQELFFTETGFTWTASAAGVTVTCAYAKSGR